MPEISITTEGDGRHGRYVTRLSGLYAEAELTFTHRGPGIIGADHTDASDALRGTGVAAALVTHLIADARARQFKVIPFGPYVRAQYRKYLECAMSSP